MGQAEACLEQMQICLGMCKEVCKSLQVRIKAHTITNGGVGDVCYRSDLQEQVDGETVKSLTVADTSTFKLLKPPQYLCNANTAQHNLPLDFLMQVINELTKGSAAQKQGRTWMKQGPRVALAALPTRL